MFSRLATFRLLPLTGVPRTSVISAPGRSRIRGLLGCNGQGPTGEAYSGNRRANEICPSRYENQTDDENWAHEGRQIPFSKKIGNLRYGRRGPAAPYTITRVVRNGLWHGCVGPT